MSKELVSEKFVTKYLKLFEIITVCFVFIHMGVFHSTALKKNFFYIPDEDILSGTLNVTIHKMNGLTEDCGMCLFVFSFFNLLFKTQLFTSRPTKVS